MYECRFLFVKLPPPPPPILFLYRSFFWLGMCTSFLMLYRRKSGHAYQSIAGLTPPPPFHIAEGFTWSVVFLIDLILQSSLPCRNVFCRPPQFLCLSGFPLLSFSKWNFVRSILDQRFRDSPELHDRIGELDRPLRQSSCMWRSTGEILQTWSLEVLPHSKGAEQKRRE